MALGTEALARASARKPWRTLGVWVVVLITAAVLSSQLLGSALTTSVSFTDNPESDQAAALIEEVRGESANTEFVVISNDTVTAADPGYVAYVAEVQSEVAALGPDVVYGVGSYLTQDGPVSESGRTALLPVTIAGSDPDTVSGNAELVVEAVDAIEAPDGYTALVAGPQTVANDINRVAEEDLRTGEMIGIAVALVVLVLVFGTVASGIIPIVLGIASIAVAMGLAALVGQVFELSFFVTNMISMIGLAVGIDYSLFIVSRYREERARGLEKIDAIARAGSTATRAVFFSGLTVVLALIGMLLLPNTIFRSLGTGAILVVLVAVGASMTLLPAVLSIMGDRINWLRVRRRGSLDNQGRFWDRVTAVVMGRPVISLVVSAGILIIFATSFFSIDTGFAGVSTLPDEIESKQAFEILEEEFSGGLASPVEVVVQGDGVTETVTALSEGVAMDGRFGPSFVDPDSTTELAILSVVLPGDVNSVESLDAVRDLRADIVPRAVAPGTAVYVGGETAITVDFLSQTDTYTPIVFAVVLGLSFILLMVAFRSIVIPGKAIVMNLLSVGAAYGLVVAFFQTGVGPEWVKDIASFLGFSQVEVIEDWIPLFLFSVLFGLSMDYHVFLLSRIKERFDITGDNTESVAYGLRTTGALITGAAAIMVAVFAGFAAGSLVTFQQMGFGLAVAVLLDATIVRTILVPASMKLLGTRNWYLPSWLEWIPNVSIEGVPHDEPHPDPDLEPVTV
ncbi:MAG: MMPL family transporter [Acidimicrobiia bacterium]|nr:MAG: MMPL family transporter [Acidimicrobiia bacterium]